MAKNKSEYARLKSRLDKLDRKQDDILKQRNKLLKEIKKLRKKLPKKQRAKYKWVKKIKINKKPKYKWRKKVQPRRIESIHDEIKENTNPELLPQTEQFMVHYNIFLQRYPNRNEHRPYRPEWEDGKQIIIKGDATDTPETIRMKAPTKIEEHWQAEAISGTEVEIAWRQTNFDYEDRFDSENIPDWLNITNVRNITNTPEMNSLPAYGRSWKNTLVEHLNKKEFKLTDGTCILDYLDQKISGRSGYTKYTREVIKKRLYELTGKQSGYSPNDVELLIYTDKLNITLIILNGNYEITKAYYPDRRKNHITLCYINTNKHIYPIENQSLFESITRGHMEKIQNFDSIHASYKSEHKANFKNFKYFDPSDVLCVIKQIINKYIKPLNHKSDKNIPTIASLINSFLPSRYIDFINGEYDPSVDIIYFDSDLFKFQNALVDTIKITGYTPEHIRPRKTSFINPKSKQLFIGTTEYKKRYKIITQCKEKYKLLNFQWSNQTIAQTANTIYKMKFGKIRKSTHNNIAIKLLDDFATMAITTLCDKPYEQYNTLRYHIDIRKDYANVAIHILKYHDLPIFTIYNNIEKFKPVENNSFKCGLYLVNEFVIQKYKLRFQTQWMPHFEVEYLIKKRYIKQDQIALQYIADIYLQGSLISDYVEYLFANFDAKTANALWQHFYGCLNTKRYRDSRAFLTEHTDEAFSYYGHHKGDVVLTPIKNENIDEYTWLVEKRQNERLTMDNCGLYSCVIGGGHMRLLDLLDTIPEPSKTQFVGVRTDSIYFEKLDCEINKNIMNEWLNKYAILTDDTKEMIKQVIQREPNELDYNKMRPYRVEEEWNLPSDPHVLRIKKINISKYDLSIPKPQIFDKTADYSNVNMLVQGPAGSNKTGVCKNNTDIWKNNNLEYKAVTFTNVASQNLIDRGIPTANVSTLHKLLGLGKNSDTSKKPKKTTSNKLDRIAVDEYSMLGENLYIRLYEKIQKISNKRDPIIHFYGDFDQCGSVDDLVKRKITETQYIKQILGENGLILQKQYENMIDPNTGNIIEPRCDDEILKLVEYVKTYRNIPRYLFNKEYDWLWVDRDTAVAETMICKTRKKKDCVSVGILNNRLYDEIVVECRVICNKNDSNLDVYNGERYVVKNVLDDGKLLEVYSWEPNPKKRKKIPEIKKVPASYFTLGHAETTYKYQGLTLYTEFIIFQPHLMSMQEFITAITRAKKLSQIRLTNRYQLLQWTSSSKPQFKDIYKQSFHRIKTLQPASNFHLYALIYKNEIYIGYSSDSKTRFKQHAKNNACCCRHFDFENTELIKIGDFTAYNDDECRIIERAYIQDYNKFSKYTCVNDRDNTNPLDTPNKPSASRKPKKKPKKIKVKKELARVDLSKKFRICPNEKLQCWIIHASKGEKRVCRFWKRAGKDQSLLEMQKIRNELLARHYPNNNF